MNSKKASLIAVVLAAGAVALSSGRPLAQSAGVVFQNGWDSVGGTGCDYARLTDGQKWQDYGPSSTCNSPHDADIVSDEKVDGSSSLRVNFAPDGSGNGPDFRIIRPFPTNYGEVFAKWYVKWSANWVWAPQDHKVAIFGTGAGSTQDVYYNIRGNSGGRTGRVTIHVIPTDVAFSDRNFVVTPGVWHLCELHIVSGPNGRVEAKMDGQLLNLQYEAGRQSSPGNLNTGSGVGYIKLDTTYNNYPYPSGLGLYMSTWYDSVTVGTSGWIGGSGSVVPPTPPAPSAPSNLLIVR